MIKTQQEQLIEMLAQQLADEKAKLADAQALIKVLSVDPAFGVMTRPAIENELRQAGQVARYIVYGDIDQMKQVNDKYTHDGANARIKAALKIRSEDLLLKARWFSGDELVFFLVGNDPDGFCNRLRRAFEAEGLSITTTYKIFSGDIQNDVRVLDDVVEAAKAVAKLGR
jgi:GGDEF domain-containing protein